MDKTTSRILQLREAIEKQTKLYPATPKDFDCLAADIWEQTHERVSVSTLKRVWGYVDSDSTPRITTLSVLARYIGYGSWRDFCNQLDNQEERDGVTADVASEADVAQRDKTSGGEGNGGKKPAHHWLGAVAIAGVVLALLAATVRYALPLHNHSGLILKAGQTFGQPEDYLPLFGIIPSEHSWDEPLPHHQGIIVWSPWYLHPNWHNEGSPESLFPTITEYWTPTEEQADSFPPSLIQQRNSDLFFTVTRTNELRITFMRGIANGDSATFLGVYRLDRHRSDSTHLVWQRIADQCDLRSLDYLEELKN